MLDYPLLEALAAVVREGSFERAARVLHVTPSAVSQRVKLLEERLGQVLVVRAQPCRPTATGAVLCRHAEQVALLEHELRARLPEVGTASGPLPTLRLAANADSVATWLVRALAAFASRHALLFDLAVDDETNTAEMLRSGSVLGAVTSQGEPVQGCRSTRLGALRYLATCSPDFHRRHFASGVTPAALAGAPCLRFDTKDALQRTFLRRLTRAQLEPPTHWVPSPHGFLEACREGMGWGMNPEPLIREELRAGKLVELAAGRHLDVVLYWQQWRLASPLVEDLTRTLQAAARATLR
ncbi:LysR family transcriptional regulator ArgP [Archangium minus]|uniref:LysR family transcriptional regulator ArgP n=1 Tax=Archangium minus TaxID=83450 RepID=A0ABY9X2B4_9BACT|nr:LysR family transcriptional regulator ArgP [Archangium violaceum]WNG49543.1 LysR family transcriptional regulator ArgP [Archangium minus]